MDKLSPEAKEEIEQLSKKFSEDIFLRFGEQGFKYAIDHLHYLCLKEKENQAIQRPVKNLNPVRVYVDGCFDLMHSGHFNALRQAKQLGDILVVGIHTDDEITRNKGPPIMNNEEREAMVKACKWVDEVVMGVPYSPSVELLNKLNCNFGVHGDDMPTDSTGESAYGRLLKAGRLRIIRRTEGISTTTLVGRLLALTREHFKSRDEMQKEEQTLAKSGFLNTTQRISQFQSNVKRDPSSQTIVYIDGTFDMFHYGHVKTLEAAKALGDFLIVGIHDDLLVNEKKGRNHPIMTLHERALNVLACRFVDEVLLCAPWSVTSEMIENLGIKKVVSGSLGTSDVRLSKTSSEVIEEDPYTVAKELGIFVRIDSNSALTTNGIAERILKNRQMYLETYERKKKKQDVYQEDSKKNRKDLNEL